MEVRILQRSYSAKNIRELSRALAIAPSITSFCLRIGCELLEIPNVGNTEEIFVECSKIS